MQEEGEIEQEQDGIDEELEASQIGQIVEVQNEIVLFVVDRFAHVLVLLAVVVGEAFGQAILQVVLDGLEIEWNVVEGRGLQRRNEPTKIVNGRLCVTNSVIV